MITRSLAREQSRRRSRIVFRGLLAKAQLARTSAKAQLWSRTETGPPGGNEPRPPLWRFSPLLGWRP
eukprot:9420422-Pyramimonas_sp.AAC.1